jgi:hypothetical protein
MRVVSDNCHSSVFIHVSGLNIIAELTVEGKRRDVVGNRGSAIAIIDAEYNLLVDGTEVGKITSAGQTSLQLSKNRDCLTEEEILLIKNCVSRGIINQK